MAPEAALSLLLGQAVSEIRHEHPDPHSGEGDSLGLAVATVITLQVIPRPYEASIVLPKQIHRSDSYRFC